MFSFLKNKNLNLTLDKRLQVHDTISPDANFWRDVDDEMTRRPSESYKGFTCFVDFLKNKMPLISLSTYKGLVVVLSSYNNKHIFKITDVKRCHFLDNRDLVFVLKNGDFFTLSCLDEKVCLYLMVKNGDFLWKDYSYGFNLKR